MGQLISLLANFLNTASLAKFLAFKVMLFALFSVVLPVVLWNFLLEWVAAVLAFAIGQIQTNVGQNALYDMQGLTGWIAIQLQLPGAINNIISAVGVRLVVQKLLSI